MSLSTARFSIRKPEAAPSGLSMLSMLCLAGQDEAL